MVMDWTAFEGPALGGMTYNADWAIQDAHWLSATDGMNWVSVRLVTSGGAIEMATDVFFFRKDTIDPVVLDLADNSEIAVSKEVLKEAIAVGIVGLR